MDKKQSKYACQRNYDGCWPINWKKGDLIFYEKDGQDLSGYLVNPDKGYGAIGIAPRETDEFYDVVWNSDVLKRIAKEDLPEDERMAE